MKWTKRPNLWQSPGSYLFNKILGCHVLVYTPLTLFFWLSSTLPRPLSVWRYSLSGIWAVHGTRILQQIRWCVPVHFVTENTRPTRGYSSFQDLRLFRMRECMATLTHFVCATRLVARVEPEPVKIVEMRYMVESLVLPITRATATY